MNIEHILVPTDLSGGARQCFPVAAAFAKAFGARITVLHVDELPSLGIRDVDALERHLELITSHRAQLLSQVERDFEGLGVTAEVTVIDGSPRKVLDDFVRAEGVGLVVMAKHTRARVERWLIGSTTKRMLRVSDAPVLVVPVDEAAADPEAALGGPSVFGHILAPTDGGSTSRTGMRAAFGLARRFGARLTAARVIAWPSVSVHPVHVMTDVRAGVEKIREQHQLALSAEVREMGGLTDGALVTIGSPAETLASVAEDKRVDLIVIPATGKGALERLMIGTTTERLIELARVPVLILPRAFVARLTLESGQLSMVG